MKREGRLFDLLTELVVAVAGSVPVVISSAFPLSIVRVFQGPSGMVDSKFLGLANQRKCFNCYCVFSERPCMVFVASNYSTCLLRSSSRVYRYDLSSSSQALRLDVMMFCA
jgi:hypothetical protein